MAHEKPIIEYSVTQLADAYLKYTLMAAGLTLPDDVVDLNAYEKRKHILVEMDRRDHPQNDDKFVIKDNLFKPLPPKEDE